MSRTRFLFTLFVCLVITASLAACSSNNSSASGSAKRTRRSQLKGTSSTHKHGTLPGLSTTSSPTNQITTPIVTVPLLSATQISETWSQQNLCSLIPAAKAQTILAMSTQPTPEYSYSSSTGARCTFSSGSGDEIYVEYSTATYGDSRSVDTALNAQGTPVVVEGVGGVSKTNKATGVTYELNFSGDASNEWIVNAPKESQSIDLAKVLITSLR